MHGSIKFRHRFFDAIVHNGPDRFGAYFQDVLDLFLLAFRETFEHVILCVRDRMLRGDADPQPCELVRSQQVDYRPKAVLSAVRALRPDTDLAEGQGEVVRYYNEPFAATLLFLEQAFNCLAAQVHVGLRLCQLDRSSVDLGPPDQSPALDAFDLGIGLRSEQINKHKPEVMPRTCVLRTRISKPDDQPVTHDR